MFKKKILAAALATTLVAGSASLTGCLGYNGATKFVGKLNLLIVDNKFLRVGVFWLLSPLYAFATLGDLVVFNSIEFWSGTNPLLKKSPPLTELDPNDSWLRVNHDMPPELTERFENGVIENMAVTSLTEQEMIFDLNFEDGVTLEVKAIKTPEGIALYTGDQLVGSTSVAMMQNAMAQ